jgi:hypothetical protein
MPDTVRRECHSYLWTWANLVSEQDTELIDALRAAESVLEGQALPADQRAIFDAPAVIGTPHMDILGAFQAWAKDYKEANP